MLKSFIVIDHLQERSSELLKLEIKKNVDKSEVTKLHQNEEGTLGNNKEEKAAALIIANKEKEKRAEELIKKHCNK